MLEENKENLLQNVDAIEELISKKDQQDQGETLLYLYRKIIDLRQYVARFFGINICTPFLNVLVFM